MDYWPVVLLLVGGIIIVASLWPRRGGKGESQIASASAVAAPTPAESVPTPMETTPSPAESAPEIQPEEQAPGDTTV